MIDTTKYQYKLLVKDIDSQETVAVIYCKSLQQAEDKAKHFGLSFVKKDESTGKYLWDSEDLTGYFVELK